MIKRLPVALLLLSFSLFARTQEAQRGPSDAAGLLFYLSGDHGFHADVARGKAEPNYLKDVAIKPGGAKGSFLECGDDQLLSYWAPGNIYAQRGTLSFFWRSRTPVDATEFPVFRVGYGDHSSWDMVWLRIDYNGHGFDAFVTDANLGRTRVSITLPKFPKAEEWAHIALSWDETTGIRFYVNGKLMATREATGVFDAALDQFGPHSRIIAPTGVEATYNYDRGGDIDELRIYDRALSDGNIASLAKNETPREIPMTVRNFSNAQTRQEWWKRNGWEHAAPAELPAAQTTVRKVEIHDAYDLKRWWWKGTDGIRETTWPGVYNRSHLPGRFDYFQLPDWDCYSLSGKQVTFYMPDEPWNHLEVEGGAWGRFDLLTPGDGNPKAGADPDQWDTTPQLATELLEKPKGPQRITFDLKQPITGKRVRFTNVEQEWPIAEFSAYYVHPGAEPEGIATLRYTLTGKVPLNDNPSLTPLLEYLNGRLPADEQQTMLAAPPNSTPAPRKSGERGVRASVTMGNADPDAKLMPVVNVLIPADIRGVQADLGHGSTYSWENMHAGLDGIALDLPALNIAATHNGVIPMKIEIADPIWPMRDMMDFSFSVKPGEPHTLWLDTRDRMLPNGKSLLIRISSASPEFGRAQLEGAKLRLIFKPWKDALPEHVADRLTQVRDNYANLVEESVNSRKLNIFNRFDADISDLLRVDPENDLGRKYWNEVNKEQIRPPFTPPAAPAGVPQWAWLQVEDLARLKRQILWYVDHRQITNGEFGGGLSDDSDFLNWWPGLAMMGAEPDKLKASLEKTLDTMYAQNMFTNGLATAQYDELHSYEDGINVLGQSMLIDFGNPKQIERAMVTAKRLEWLTGINSAGQRQVRSVYYSGSKMAEGGVWGWAKNRSFFVFHPALELVMYNGMPETRKMILELADGFLAHRHPDADGKMRMHFSVNFHTNEDLPGGGMEPWFILWAAYQWTGDQKYLQPFADDPATALRTINADAMDILNVRDTWGRQLLKPMDGPDRRTESGNTSELNLHFQWQLTGDTRPLEKLYALQIRTAEERKFINTEGSLWIDRVYLNNGELQRARLGGVALMRNYVYPGQAVSWRFDAPADDHSVAILIPTATADHLKITTYNLEDKPVTAHMTGWEVDPGTWEITQGTQATQNGPVEGRTTRSATFERSREVVFTLAPHTTTDIEMKLKEKGTPYWQRPDIGISRDDVKLNGNSVQVTVHSLGAVDAPAGFVILRDTAGRELARAKTPPLKAPLDLVPKTATITLHLRKADAAKQATVNLELSGSVPETTDLNNHVTLQ